MMVAKAFGQSDLTTSSGDRGKKLARIANAGKGEAFLPVTPSTGSGDSFASKKALPAFAA